MIRQERRRIERKLRDYKVIPTDEKLTASTGIGVLVEILLIFQQKYLLKCFQVLEGTNKQRKISDNYIDR